MRRTHASLLTATLLTAGSLLTGCTVLQSLGIAPKADRAEVAEVGPLPNATCEAHWRSFPEAPLADPAAPAEAKVVDALCWPMDRDDPRAGADEASTARGSLSAAKRPYVQAHFAFEDRRPDPLQASLIVTGCVDHGTCEAKRSYVVGQMATYAELATPRAVEQAMAGLELPDGTKAAYLKHYADARAQVLELADAMPDKDVEVCRELPRTIRDRRADDYETFADHHDRFEALWPRLSGVMAGDSGDQALLDEAVALRDEHVAACAERSTLEPLLCWHATPARPLTEAIARMAARQGDAARARVELETLESGPDLFTTGNEISYAQTKQMGRGGSTRAYTAWDRMPTIGHDEDLAKLAGSMDGLEWVTAEIERVETTGDEATIHLQTRVSKRTDFICKDTSKIDRIDNGKVYYKQKCRKGKTHVTRTPFDPVTVPATDVPGLVEGQMVKVVVESSSRRGHLLEVVADKAGLSGKRKRLRLRSTPLARE